MRKHLSPAMIVALIALFFALTGGAVAAQRYIITKPSQIKPSVRTALNGQRGPQGPMGLTGQQGPQGATGLQGPQGPQGPAGSGGALDVSTVKATAFASPGAIVGAQAFCPAGKVVIGSGFYGGGTQVGFVQPIGTTSVGGGFGNNYSSTVQVEVYAICAPGTATAAASTGAAAASTKTAARDEFQDKLDALRANR